MSRPKLSFILLLSLFTLSCETAVLDLDGPSIGNARPSLENAGTASTPVVIRDLNVKGVIPYIDMETGKVNYDRSELEGHELSIAVDFSVFQVYVRLGEDHMTGMPVEALNSGVKDFHALLSAPTSGYRMDSENEGLVIGNKFYDGGNGWTGFHMTGDVYILKTRSGKYAKLQFLKARQGNIDLQYYVQQDGSMSLRTEEK